MTKQSRGQNSFSVISKNGYNSTFWNILISFSHDGMKENANESAEKRNINMPLHTHTRAHARTHTHTYCKYNRPLVPKLGKKKSKTDSRKKYPIKEN